LYKKQQQYDGFIDKKNKYFYFCNKKEKKE